MINLENASEKFYVMYEAFMLRVNSSNEVGYLKTAVFPSEMISKATGKTLHKDYVLPYGIDADHLQTFLVKFGARKDKDILEELYNEFVRLNPELGEIDFAVTVRDNPMYDIVLGAISKFSIRDIEYFLTKRTLYFGSTFYLDSEVVDGVVVDREKLVMIDRTIKSSTVEEHIGQSVQYVINDEDLDDLYNYVNNVSAKDIEEDDEADDETDFDLICVGNELTLYKVGSPISLKRFSITCQDFESFFAVNIDDKSEGYQFNYIDLKQLKPNTYYDTINELVLIIDPLVLEVPEGYY